MVEYVTHRPPTLREGKPPVLIVMHGYGADENDLISIAKQVDPNFLAISLRAPIKLSWGGFAWYHLEQTASGLVADDLSRHDSEAKVVGSLRGIIEKEGGDLSNVWLMGFSQGTAMAYSIVTTHTLSDYDITVKGVIAMSGYLPRDILAELHHKNFGGLPVFISHGEFDDLIPPMAMNEASELLAERGAEVTSNMYEIGHGVSPETIDDIREWIQTVKVLA